jgi:hypothetical protein
MKLLHSYVAQHTIERPSFVLCHSYKQFLLFRGGGWHVRSMVEFCSAKILTCCQILVRLHSTKLRSPSERFAREWSTVRLSHFSNKFCSTFRFSHFSNKFCSTYVLILSFSTKFCSTFRFSHFTNIFDLRSDSLHFRTTFVLLSDSLIFGTIFILRFDSLIFRITLLYVS